MSYSNGMDLISIDDGLRKEVNGVILAIEQGTTLGISFIDRKTKDVPIRQPRKSSSGLLFEQFKEKHRKGFNSIFQRDGSKLFKK